MPLSYCSNAAMAVSLKNIHLSFYNFKEISYTVSVYCEMYSEKLRAEVALRSLRSLRSLAYHTSYNFT